MSLTITKGTIIEERFQIVQLIGQGGMGAVYEAEQIGLERRVAIKLVHHSLVKDGESISRFEREAMVLSNLEHKNLATFYCYGIWQKTIPYIAMEFLEGESLRHRIDREFENEEFSAPRLHRLLSILIQVAEAIAFVHTNNILHRDLKPNNILITKEGVAKVVDFGLAKMLATDSSEFQKLTQTGMLVGTAQYLSPEICKGETPDQRADIYSFGCILYECITGQPPHSADNPIGLMHKHVNEAVIAPSTLTNSPIPEELDIIVSRALAKLPSDRYESMQAIKEDLQKTKEKLTTLTGKLTIGGNQQGVQKKNKLALIAGIAILLAGALCIPVILDSLSHKNANTDFSTKSEKLSEASVYNLLQRAYRLMDTRKNDEAISILERIVNSKITRNGTTYKLRALAQLARLRNDESDTSQIENLVKKSLSDRSGNPDLYKYANYALYTLLSKLYERQEYDKLLSILSRLEKNKSRVKGPPWGVFFLDIELLKRQSLQQTKQHDQILVADSILKKQLSERPEDIAAANALFFYDSTLLNGGEKDNAIAFQQLILSIQNLNDSPSDLLHSLATISAASSDPQRIVLTSTMLDKLLATEESPAIRQGNLYSLLLAAKPSWSDPAFRNTLDRIYKSSVGFSYESSYMRAQHVMNLATAYTEQNEPTTAAVILKDSLPDLEAMNVPEESKLSRIQAYVDLIDRNERVFKELNQDTLELIKGIYLSSIDKLLRTTSLQSIPNIPYGESHLSMIIVRKDGVKAAAEFEQKIRNALRQSNTYDKLPDSAKLDILIIPGGYPSSPEQAEFTEIKQIAEHSRDVHAKCIALLAMHDAYDKVHDTQNRIKVLDESLRLPLADDASIQRWAIHYRGCVHDEKGDERMGERMLWRALRATESPPENFDQIAFNHFSTHLISRYEKRGNVKLAAELRHTQKDPSAFLELQPKNLDK